jgi:hypothetical protein
MEVRYPVDGLHHYPQYPPTALVHHHHHPPPRPHSILPHQHISTNGYNNEETLASSQTESQTKHHIGSTDATENTQNDERPNSSNKRSSAYSFQKV